MDINRLTTWEKVVGVAGLVLSLSLFLPWWQLEGSGETLGISGWEGMGIADIIFFLGGLAVAALVAAKAAGRNLNLPVGAGVAVFAIGILCALLGLYRMTTPPSVEDVGGAAGDAAAAVEEAESIGVPGVIEISEGPILDEELKSMFVVVGFLLGGLLAIGGWKLMQEEGTDPGGQVAQLRSRVGAGSGTLAAPAPGRSPQRTSGEVPAPPPLSGPPPPPPATAVPPGLERPAGGATPPPDPASRESAPPA
jgi:hypothetical protein